jgi:hypothetical protein
VLPPSGQRWVVESLHDAARIAAQRGGVVSAVSYLRRAIDEPPEPDQHAQLLLELGMAEVMAIEPAPAADHLWAAYATLKHNPLMRARIAEILSRMLLLTGPPEDAVAVVQRALRATRLSATVMPGSYQPRRRLPPTSRRRSPRLRSSC